jgi:hypothetical protein
MPRPFKSRRSPPTWASASRSWARPAVNCRGSGGCAPPRCLGLRRWDIYVYSVAPNDTSCKTSVLYGSLHEEPRANSDCHLMADPLTTFFLLSTQCSSTPCCLHAPNAPYTASRPGELICTTTPAPRPKRVLPRTPTGRSSTSKPSSRKPSPALTISLHEGTIGSLDPAPIGLSTSPKTTTACWRPPTAGSRRLRPARRLGGLEQRADVERGLSPGDAFTPEISTGKALAHVQVSDVLLRSCEDCKHRRGRMGRWHCDLGAGCLALSEDPGPAVTRCYVSCRHAFNYARDSHRRSKQRHGWRMVMSNGSQVESAACERATSSQAPSARLITALYNTRYNVGRATSIMVHTTHFVRLGGTEAYGPDYCCSEPSRRTQKLSKWVGLVQNPDL